MKKLQAFFITYWKSIFKYLVVIALSIGFSVGTVATIFYGYYDIGGKDPTTITIEPVEFIDTTNEQGTPITGFKLTDESTGIQYLVTDEWAPLQLVSKDK